MALRGGKCICGCGRKRGLQLHHVVYQQELRRLARERVTHGPGDVAGEMILCADRRNMVMVGPKCHAAHHNRSRPFSLRLLPDSVYEFAEENMGAGRAYEYLRRRYAGGDQRIEALLSRSERIEGGWQHPGQAISDFGGTVQ